MERTGHRSMYGVRVYKRSSAEQHAQLSRVLNGETENSTPLMPPSAFSSCEKENEPPTSKASQQQSDVQTLDNPANLPNLPNPLSLVQCHGITINYNFGHK